LINLKKRQNRSSGGTKTEEMNEKQIARLYIADFHPATSTTH
jgi:hypothetical protein